MKSLSLVSLLGVVIATNAWSETRQHEAHEHGAASLNIAQEGAELMVMLESPAANIVGFEHAPKSHEEEAIILQSLNQLKQGEKLFVINKEAKCELTEVALESPFDVDSEEHEEHHEHEEHYEEHDDHHEDEHHHESESGSVHSDIEVTYHFQCASVSALRQMDVAFFKHFPKTEELDVQMVTDNKQAGFELTAQKRLLAF